MKLAAREPVVVVTCDEKPPLIAFDFEATEGEKVWHGTASYEWVFERPTTDGMNGWLRTVSFTSGDGGGLPSVDVECDVMEYARGVFRREGIAKERVYEQPPMTEREVLQSLHDGLKGVRWFLKKHGADNLAAKVDAAIDDYRERIAKETV